MAKNVKFQALRTLKVVPSDTIGIPDIATKNQKDSRAATSTTANKLVDSSEDFTADGTEVGDIVHNTTDNTIATVTAIDSATTLSLSADIMANTESYDIYKSATDAAALYVGVSGDVTFIDAGGDTNTMVAAPVGWHPIQVKQVKSTGTTATDILAGWG
jgi:hypothetical protein